MLARSSLRSARTFNGLRNGASAVTKVGYAVPSLCRGIHTRARTHDDDINGIDEYKDETGEQC